MTVFTKNGPLTWSEKKSLELSKTTAFNYFVQSLRRNLRREIFTQRVFFRHMRVYSREKEGSLSSYCGAVQDPSVVFSTLGEKHGRKHFVWQDSMARVPYGIRGAARNLSVASPPTGSRRRMAAFKEGIQAYEKWNAQHFRDQQT